ncbi:MULTISPECIES: DUF7019 family protein [unclassified Streptomyces]|uniref:DUF7019 family protein n=1 Tax=unclassified Streptomyces TaxID=2593676 RepID=UPI0004BD3673|nr:MULTISPECIES: SAVMC3_10250 family protein [unclassified Streptomyces]
MSFRYYLYISDSKVDMMLAQIDPALSRKKTSELSVDLKIFSAKRGLEFESGTDRIVRLERVMRHLEEFGDLGSIEEPGQFFRGSLPMRWGPFHGTSLVYFGGGTGRTVVGLGGSGRYVLGSLEQSAEQSGARSVMPSLIDGLTAEPEVEDLLGRGTGADADVLQAVRLANDRLRGPVQHVEFIAKRLLHGQVEGQSIVLGTPLYVALVD